MIVIGADPGRSAAVAMVSWAPLPNDLDGDFAVLSVHAVFGSASKSKKTDVKRDLKWGERLDVVVDDALALPHIDAVYIEEPSGKGKSRKRLGPDTWLRMGHFQGRLMQALRMDGVEPERVTTELWSQVCGVANKKTQLPYGRTPFGWHRCEEAAALTDWPLPSVPASDTEAERLVAQAESILIAVAGLRLELGLH